MKAGVATEQSQKTQSAPKKKPAEGGSQRKERKAPQVEAAVLDAEQPVMAPKLDDNSGPKTPPKAVSDEIINKRKKVPDASGGLPDPAGQPIPNQEENQPPEASVTPNQAPKEPKPNSEFIEPQIDPVAKEASPKKSQRQSKNQGNSQQSNGSQKLARKSSARAETPIKKAESLNQDDEPPATDNQ